MELRGIRYVGNADVLGLWIWHKHGLGLPLSVLFERSFHYWIVLAMLFQRYMVIEIA